MLLNDIYNWIVYEGGICPTDDNHFGGPANIKSKLNLMIQQRPTELASCIKFFIDRKNIGEKLDYYAEIGACAGGTTRSIYNFLKFKELLIIDDNGAENPSIYVDKRGDLNRAFNLKGIPKIEIIGHSNEESVINKALEVSKNNLYDILFIDGDHSYNGVKNDTINYLPIVRDGGYIVFHDTTCIRFIRQWISEIPTTIPCLEKIVEFNYSDDYTKAFPHGIGLTIFQKKIV